MRIARHGCRADNNDDFDEPAFDNCAVNGTAVVNHNRDRAAKIHHVDDQHHFAAHYDHDSGRHYDFELNIDNAELQRFRQSGPVELIDIPAEDLADIGRAAVSGLTQYAALGEFNVERFERLVESLFVLLTGPYGEDEPD